jgi:Domain of unknown function (DUF4188)
MSGVSSGRYVADVEGDFVVFLIGMRLNKPWKVQGWLPVYRAMGRMLAELESQPDKGLLGWERALIGGPSCSTGAPLSTRSASPAIRATCTSRPGRSGTARHATRAT